MEMLSFRNRATVGALRDLVTQAKTGAAANRSTNPLLYAAQESLSVGWSKRDEERDLSAFLDGYAREHGKVTQLERPSHVAPAIWDAFRIQKAATLLKAGREPSQVQDMLIKASGTVDGHPIAARTLFAQRYQPQGTPKGITVVVAPGFLETGRSYCEQALAMSAKGYEVLVFDQQWAGMSSGPQGGIDRGFGITRDVAAVAAKAAEGGNKVILLGTSMGGGPGAYGAIHLNEGDRIALDGPHMPKGVAAMLQAPYFGTARSIVNDTLSLAGSIPGVRDIPLPAIGLPILSSDPVTLHKLAAHATIEHITGRAEGFHGSERDLEQLHNELPARAPKNPMYIIQGRQDALASYQATRDMVAHLGPNVHLEPLDTTNHVFEETPGQQNEIFKALDWIAAHS